MKKQFLTVLFVALGFGAIMAQTTLAGSTSFFTKADAFFKKYVFATGVDYKNLKANPADLNALVTQIGSYNLSSTTKGGQKAFYLNAYNILVIKNVVNHYPIAKPTDVVGFFDKFSFNVAGTQRSLSQIENDVIRPTYNDPRTHFALVCAARSCPPLANFAFTPEKVESQLETLTRAALNNNNFIKVNTTRSTVEFSQILEWYKADFAAVAPSTLAYVNLYRSTPIPANYVQSFYTYDWSLNVK